MFYSGLYFWKKKIPEKKVDRRYQIQNNFQRIFKASGAHCLLIFGELIAIVIITILFYALPESLPSDVLNKKYFGSLCIGILSCGGLFSILYYFQGEELHAPFLRNASIENNKSSELKEDRSIKIDVVCVIFVTKN